MAGPLYQARSSEEDGHHPASGGRVTLDVWECELLPFVGRDLQIESWSAMP